MKMTQEQMLRGAEQKTFDQNRVWVHIQGGSNPLTDAEIEKLIAKNPVPWGRFRGMGGAK
jgi:hypothetical protein